MSKKYTFEHTSNESKTSGKGGGSKGKLTVELSKSDQAAQKKVNAGLRELKDVLKKQTKDTSSSALMRMLEKVIKASGQSSKISSAELKALATAFANELSRKGFGGSKGATVSGQQGKAIDPNIIAKAISSQIAPALKSVFKSLETKDIKIDPKSQEALRKAMESSVSDIIPSKFYKVINDLNSTLASVLALSKTSLKAFNSAKGMASDKGGLEFKEVAGFYSNLKKGSSELKNLVAQVSSLVKEVSKLPTELKAAAKGMVDAAKSAKTRTVAGARAVRESSSGAQANLVKEGLKTLSSEIKKHSGGSSNPNLNKLTKALDTFSAGAGELTKLTKALDNFGKSISSLQSDKAIDLKGLQGVLGNFEKTLNAIPTEIKGGAVKSPEWKNFISQSNKVIDTVKTLVVKIQSPREEIDKFMKQLPGEFDVVANIDTSNVPKAIKEITKPVGIPVKVIFSADEIQKRLRYEHPEINVTQRLTTVHKLIEEHQSSKSGRPTKDISIQNTKSEAVKFAKDLNTGVNNLIKVLENLSKVHATAYDKPVPQGSPGDIASDRIDALISKIQDKRGNTSQLREYVDKTQGYSHKSGILSQAARDGIKEVYEILHSTTDDVFNSVKKSSDQTTKNIEEVGKAFDSISKSSKQMADAVSRNLAQTQPSTIPSKHGATAVNTARQAPASTQKEVYKYFEGNITPGRTAKIDTGKKLNLGEDSRKIVQEHVSGLANSLLDLQQYMVSTLDKEFTKVRKESNSGKDWRIVGKDTASSITDYFKLTEGYNQKTSGNEYSFKIADVKNLKRVTGSKTSDPTALISKFKEGVFKELLAKNEATIAESIGRWMKRFSESDISSWKGLDSNTTRQLANIKATHDKGQGTAPSKKMVEALKGLGTSNLTNIFEKTISDIEATRRLGEKKYGSSVLVKKIAIPAAKLSATGAATIDTATGSKRIIPKFATYKTGFEKVFESLQKTKTLDIEQNYQGKVRELGIRPSGTRFEEANKVAKAMLVDLSRVKDVINAAGQTTVDSGAVRADLAKKLETSVVLKAGKLEKSKHVSSAADVLTKIDKSIYAEFASGTKTMEEFIAATSKAGVSAYDLVKGMESIDFQNIYQIFQKILEGSDSIGSPLKNVGKNPDFSKSVRDLESYIGKMVGTIPIADPSRPRRASHQEKVINLMSMTSPIYSQKGKVGTQGLTAEGQKQFLRDLNLSLREFVSDTAILKKADMGQGRLPADVRTLSSLGVPESQAGTISEYRKDGRNENTKYLAALNATTVKMYSDTLSEMAPFGAQFQQLGRNISNTTNAMAYRPGGGRIGTDFPALRSERETKLISGGRYGEKGYGFNVVAELRNTASTFEDQIVISGKLADVLTSVTKTIVQPDKLGRLNLVGADGQVSQSQEGRIEDIKTGPLVSAIEEANRVFQDVLGVKQEYRGRADDALIKQVMSSLTTVRGKDVQVQSAKIAETFFNYYGRKFTTRYGSKGVSITAPGGTGELTGKQLKNLYADKKVKVLGKAERATAGLGTVALPKSMGQLVQEIYRKYAEELGLSDVDLDESRKALINSGNKFMLSMFTDPSLGVVPEGKDVKAQQALFNKTKIALAKLDFDLAKDISGIKGLVEVYKGMDGAKLYEEKPIDIRISSHGIAKRGLQAENLEAIMNNVIDAGVAGSTSLKTKFDPSTYKRLLGTEEDTTGKFPSLNEISKVLGFETVSDDPIKVSKEIMQLLTQRKGLISEKAAAVISEKPLQDRTDVEKKALQQRQEGELQAKKLAELELSSNFYSEIRDEFGKSRKSLIGPKFVEVIEDPHANPAWSETDIKKQVAGQKINIPAFGAYATVFGEQSQFIKQMTSSIPLDSKKHWEYLKALQVLNDDSSEMATQLLKSAQEVDVSSLRTFTKSTGKFVPKSTMANITEVPEEDQERILNDTILDIAKFPGAMNLKIPSTKDPSKRESFYVPGALARTTYPEPSLAGERGLDMTARRLQAVVNAAKRVDEVAGQSDESGSKKLWNTVGRIKKRLAGYRGRVKGIVGESPKTKQLTSGEVGELESILNTLLATLDQSPVDERMLYANQQHLKGGTRGDVIRAFKDYKSGSQPQAEVYQTTINQAVDQLIGPQGSPDPKNPQFASRYDKQANVLGGKARNAGLASIEQFARSLNVQPSDSEDDLKKALQSLERAKIEYYSTLATSALGKTGSVQEFLFNRKMPAVMGKAINATVDKTEDLDNFSKELLSISSSTGDIGVDLSALKEASTNIDKIRIEHAENVESARSKGMPVLTQHQVGIPESYASKLPTTFARRYEVDGKNVQELKTPIVDKSNLAKMLDYREEIKGALDNVAPGMRSKMEAYLKSELSPYLESMRFPVTGVASIQPYEAKLLKQGEGRQMAKHTLMAPGMPEMDMGKFDAAKKQVDTVIAKLAKERKEEYEEESPDLERINQLTATIASLDKAISNVIPKFIAVQQNLDFDGDQIQLHAAKTALARQEIAKHFKTITDYDSQKGTTAQALRDQSTYGALIPSTEKYTLAEQQIAFSKKFPEKEGFGFMTKPFLTEGLDYLKPQEQLDILSTFPGAGGTENTPLTVLNNLLPELFRNEKHMAKIAMTLQAVKPEVGKDTSSSKALLDALAKMKSVEDQPGSGREKAVFEEGIKTKLYDTKMTNAINANFFKLNTGQDTEALNRQLKIFERNLGYGGGVIRQGAQYEPTANLAKRFPLDLKSMGNVMGEELHTMMNEFLRVGVQKGLDVKHAGETPIATEMAQYISQGSPGVTKLIDKINTGEGSYGDLTDFAEANKKSLGRRLGGMSTEDLYLDAANIAEGRGESTTKLDPGNREELKKYITKSIGFEGFLHELSNQVIEAAYDGLMKSVSTWSDTKKQKEFKGSSAEDYVKASIRKQLKGDGINILDSAENPLMPLYKMRTSGASGYQQRGIYQDKYGDVETPELEGIFQGKEADAYIAKYKEAKAVAKNIQDALIDFSSNKGGNRKGSYSMLLESSINNIYADQKEIMKLVQEMSIEKDRTSSSVMDRLSGDAPMHGFTKEALGKKNSKTQKDFLEKYSRIVGVPSLGQESTALLEQEYLPQAAFLASAEKGPPPLQGVTTDTAYQDILVAHDKAVDKLKEQYLADAIVIAQTDNILKAAKTKTGEATFLTQLLPTAKDDYASKSYNDRRQRIAAVAQEKVQRAAFESTTSPRDIDRGVFGRSMPSGGGPGGPGALSAGGSGPIVNVHIASVAEGVGVFLGKAAGMAKTTEGTSPRFAIPEELEKRLVRAEEIVDEITGGLNKATGDSFENKYRASGLKGGQGLDQINEIKKQMQGIKADRKARDILDSSSLLGTGIHAKLEGSYKDKKYVTEKPVRYASAVGEISGTVDAIKYDDNKIATHIVDIKTTSQKNYDDLKQAVVRFQEETGKETPTLDEIKDYVGKNLKDTKLGDVASQLNLYLAATSENARASAHFFSRTNPDQEPIKIDQFFDKERLDKDVDAVGQARREIKLEGGSFAKTASYAEAEEIEDLLKKKEVAEATIAELIATGTEYYTLVTKQGLRARKNMPSKGGLSDKSLNMIGTRAREFQAQSAKFDDMVTANPIAEGRETYKVHQNLNVMHERAKYFQQKEGYETSGPRFDKMHPQIQERVTEHGEKGPGGAAFSALVTELKDTGKIEGGAINAAWKAYRLAVGDYFVKKMAAARKELDSTDPGADNIVDVFGKYQKSVQAFQDFAKQGLGKPTDIYTYNKQYLHAESARGAGVYMDSAALQKKASQPLGEDPTLHGIFQRMTDLEGDAVPIPRDSIRAALEDLMDVDTTLIKLYTSAEKVAKMGSAINAGWNFDKVKGGLSRLRAALDLQLKQPVGELYNEDQITYLKTVLKDLKGLENIYINLDLDTDLFSNPTGEYKFPTLEPVPKQLSRDLQAAQNVQNIQRIKTHYETPEDEGGAREGDSFVYNAKTFGPSGKQMDNQRFVISKYGEAINGAGKAVPILKSRLDNLNQSLVDGNRTFSVAIERVVKWGAAATLVYGGLSYIQDAVKHMSDVETAMARLRMVMNPLATDFDGLQQSALGFAKQYGVETTDVLSSMKVFAQQGLSQGEVENRTQTSTLAANVTTLSAVDATEALTASMKVFKAEGEDSMRFLDAWSQVEARAAITAGDLADAIKKSASAGKNAGFTFDELNGMVAAIGSTTRQTGKEVGTSLRFIFRRISADKGPKALKKVGVDTISEKGNLRPGYDVLSDLAGQWDTLGQAQKLSIAQAIGGTRQYNQVLVLMDNWDQVIKSVGDSMNSKGSAERRNLKLMKTYAKQLEQTKAVFSALKIEVGKVVLPSFKAGLTGIRTLVEVVNNIPGSFKLAGAGMVLFVGYITKGAAVLNNLINLADRTKLSFAGLSDDFAKGIKKGAFEVFGMGDTELDPDLFGMSKLGTTGTINIDDMESSLGKLAFGALSAGQAFNKFAGVVVGDSGSAISAVSKYIGMTGKLLDYTGRGIAMIPGIPGPVDEAIGTAVKFTGDAIEGGASAFDFVGQKLGKGAQSFIEGFASQNSSAMKSLAPLLGTLGGLALLAPTVKSAFKDLTQSAKDYKDEQLDRLEVDAKEIDSIQALLVSYEALGNQKEKISKLASPDTQKIGIKRNEFKSPVLKQIESIKASREFDASIGMLDPTLIAGFDDFDRVVLRNKGNMKGYLEDLKRIKTLSMAQSKIKIASRFTDDLTKTDGNQEWKYQVQELAKEFPLIGEALADQIAVGPKKALEIIREELERLLMVKAENPITTAYDEDIKKSLLAHSKVLKTFNSTYLEMTKTLNSIEVKGTSLQDVTNLYNTPDAIKNFNLQAEREDKYKVAGAVTGKDIAASKILATQAGGLGQYIEASSVLTEANLFTAGRRPRKQDPETGKINAESGDWVTIYKDMADEFGIATQQAKFIMDKEGNLFLSYVDKELNIPVTKKVDQSQVESMVRGFFPTEEIILSAQEEITKLNTFISGASAGIMGLSSKDLKRRQFDLGEMFYDQIPTNTLIQTTKGYNSTDGTFGEQSYKKNWDTDFVDKYFDPLKDLEGLKSLLGESTEVTGGTGPAIARLQDILKNNSIVLQYRSAIEDLGKAMYEGERATRKSIEVEKARHKMDTETGGLMRGTTKGTTSLDLGVSDYKDLSDQQRASSMFEGFDALSKKILLQEQAIEGIISQGQSAASNYADLQEIGATSGGFGALMSKERHTALLDTMEKTGDDKGAAVIAMSVKDLETPLKAIQESVAISAANSSKDEKVIAFNQQIADNALIKAETIKARNENPDRPFSSNRVLEAPKLFKSLGKLVDQRDDAAKAGDTKTVSRLDTYLTEAYSRTLKAYGAAATIKYARGESGVGLSSSKDKDASRALSYALSGLGASPESLRQGIESKKRADSQINYNPMDRQVNRILLESDQTPKHVKRRINTGLGDYRPDKYDTALRESYDLESKKPLVDPKIAERTLLVTAIASAFTGASLGDKRKKIEEEITVLAAKRAALEPVGKEGEKADINRAINARKDLLKTDLAPRKFIVDTLKGMSVSALAAYKGVGFLGGDDVDKERMAVVGAGIYGTMKALETRIGKENMPKYFKDFSKKVGTSMEEVAESGNYDKLFEDVGGGLKRFLGGFNKDVREQKYQDKTDIGKSEPVDQAKKDREKLNKLNKAMDLQTAKKQLNDRLGADGKGFIRLIEAGFASAVGATLMGYSADPTQDKINAGEAASQEQAKTMLEYIRNNTNATDVWVKQLESGRSTDKVGKEEEKTGRKDIIMDPLKELELSIAESMKTGETLQQAIASAKGITGDLKIFASLYTDVARVAGALENFSTELKKMFTTFDDKRTLDPIRTLKGQLAGFGGEITLPVGEREMSSQQRLYAGGSKDIKSAFTLLSKAALVQESNLKLVDFFRSEIATKEGNINFGIGTGGSPEQLKLWNDELKILEVSLEIAKASTSKTSKQMQEFGVVMRGALQYSTALNKLNDALQDVSVEHAVTGINGLKTYFETFDKLMGGSDPLAAIAISPEQERMGARVGVPLVHGESNAMQLERAQLLTTINNATDSKTRDAAGEQLGDLEKKYRRLGITQGTGKETQRLSATMKPYQDFVSNMESLLQTSGISDENYGTISDIKNKVITNMNKATTPVPIDQAIADLRARKDDIGPNQFKELLAELVAFKEDGAESVYRGIGQDGSLQEEMARVTKQFEAQLKAKGADTKLGNTLGSMVRDPLVKAIGQTNALLKALVADQLGPQVVADIEAKYAPPPKPEIPAPAHKLKGFESFEGMRKEYSKMDFTSTEDGRGIPYSTLGEKPDSRLATYYGDLKSAHGKPADTMFDSHPKEAISFNKEMVAIMEAAENISGASSESIEGEKDLSFNKEMVAIMRTIATNTEPSKNMPVPNDAAVEPITKAAGGYVFGEGGPREDKVPAYLSRGEFVIRAAAAQHIGYENLDVMNKKGQIPLAFESGGKLSAEHINKAQGYFNDPDASLPEIFDPKSKLFNKGITGKYLELRKSMFSEEVRGLESVSAAASLKDLYNATATLVDDEGYSEKELFFSDTANILDKLKESQEEKGILGWMRGKLKNKSAATAGTRAITGMDRAEQLKELNTYADGGRAISTVTGKPVPTAEETEEGMAKMREALGFVASVGHPLTSIPTSIYGAYQGFKEKGLSAQPAVEGFGALELLNYIPQAKRLGKMKTILSKGFGRYFDNAGDINDYFDVTGKLGGLSSSHGDEFDELLAEGNTFGEGGLSLWDKMLGKQFDPTKRWEGKKLPSGMGKFNTPKVTKKLEDEVKATKRHDVHSFSFLREKHGFVKALQLYGAGSHLQEGVDVLKKADGGKIRSFIGDSTGVAEVGEELFDERINTPVLTQSVASMLKSEFGTPDAGNNQLGTSVDKLLNTSSDPGSSMSSYIANSVKDSMSFTAVGDDIKSYASTTQFNAARAQSDKLRGNIGKGNIIPGMKGLDPIYNEFLASKYNSPFLSQEEQNNNRAWYEVTREQEAANKQKYEMLGEAKTAEDKKQIADYWKRVGTPAESNNDAYMAAILKQYPDLTYQSQQLAMASNHKFAEGGAAEEEDAEATRRWGHTTAKGVMDKWSAEAKDTAMYRSLHAMSAAEDFKIKLRNQKKTRADMQRVLADNDYISPDTEKTYEYTADKRRGLKILTDSETGLKMGKVLKDSYRFVDTGYGPKAKDNTKTTVHDPFGVSEDAYSSGALNDFSKRLSLDSDYGNEAFRYHSEGRDIWKSMQRYKKLASTKELDSRKHRELLQKYNKGQVALDKVRLVMDVLEEGGNIYDDPRLQQEVMVDEPAPYSFGAKSNLKFNQFGVTKHTSALRDIKAAAAIARGELDPMGKDGKGKGAVVRTTMPILPNTNNAVMEFAAKATGRKIIQPTASEWEGIDLTKENVPVIKKLLASTTIANIPREAVRQMQDFININGYNVGGVATRSLPVKHFGGVITQTGPVFAEKGETIIPKGFKDGTSGVGGITSSPASRALTSGTIKLDGSEILAKLNSLSLKVDTTPLKLDIAEIRETRLQVEETTLKIDSSALSDVKLQVEDTVLKVEATPVPLDISALEGLELKVDSTPIPVDSSNVKLDIDGADTKLSSAIGDALGNAAPLKVEDKQLTVTAEGLTIDIGDAESRLASAISNAISSAVVNVKIEAPTATGGSVGADKFDQLAQTVSDVNDKLMSSAVIIEDKVKVLEGSIGPAVDESVEKKLASKLTDINQSVTGALLGVDTLTNNVTTQIDSIKREANEIKYLAQLALNARGTGNIT